MFKEISFFEVIRSILFWASPVIFIVGIFLLVAEYRYRELEKVLGKEIGGIRRIIIPRLETTIYTFQESLLGKRFIVGSICIICSILFFFVFRS